MDTHVALIKQPDVDFDSLIGVAHTALGYNPASKADGDSRKLSVTEKYISCLAAISNRDALVGLSTKFLKHVSISVMFGADEKDMRDILECCSGMPFVSVDTVHRGSVLSIVTGTLADWRDAVIIGVGREIDQRVRTYFCEVQAIFEGAGMSIWKDYTKKTTHDKLYLLELHV